MIYAQRKAIASEKLLWFNTKAGRTCIGFLSNKYIPPRESWDFTHVLALELLQLSM
jgi:hypothetical protein